MRAKKLLTGPLGLVLLITSVYVPFMGSRFIRTAGDEKVYVSQAIEMEHAHHWFIQTLQDEPNYYKGPLHYILLRAGMIAFGRSNWATLYMNYLLLVLGALAVAAVVRRRYPDWTGGDIWTGAAFALGTGIYAHAFASQMEIELASLFAIATWLLDRMEPEDAGWAFWTVTAIVGWVKSPLHSAFLGASALLYSALRGDLKTKLKTPKAWAAVTWGIALCIAGYLPAYIFDQKNFWDAYVIRETLRKSDGSGQGWSVAVVSTFGFYLFPWLFLALVAYAQTLTQGVSLWRKKASQSLLKLGFSVFLPSVIFFCWFNYRFENYNLPVICGVWLWIACCWGATQQGTSEFWKRAYAGALGLTGVLLLAIPVLLTVLAVHFSPLPTWWPAWLVPVSWAGCLLSAFGFIYFGMIEKGRRPHLLALTSGGYLWALGALFVVLGTREMIDLQTYIHQAQAQNRPISLGYYNLNRNIWSEWGYLNFWVDHEVHGLHTPQQLTDAIDHGETILVSAKEDGVRDFKNFVKKNFPDTQFRYIPWKRWRTHGEGSHGKPLWLEAWEKRDLSLMEVNYYIVEPISKPLIR